MPVVNKVFPGLRYCGADVDRHGILALALLSLSLILLSGCDDLIPRDTASLLLPSFQKSEIVGFLAGLFLSSL
jgi:hypothetical protein